MVLVKILHGYREHGLRWHNQGMTSPTRKIERMREKHREKEEERRRIADGDSSRGEGIRRIT